MSSSGFGFIPVTNVLFDGDFIDQSPVGNGIIIGPGQTGGSTITFDPAGQFELVDDVGFPLGTFLFANLPAGFQITGILKSFGVSGGQDMNAAAKVSPWPAVINAGSVDMKLVNWVTSFGWTEANQTFDAAVAAALLSSFTFTGSFADDDIGGGMVSTNGEATGSGFTYTGVVNPAGFPVNANVLIFTWDDQAIPPVESLGPITNPIIETGPPNPVIIITVPPGATEVIIEVPGNPPITVPVTPGPNTIIIPITIVPIITITPANPGNNTIGPPIAIPVDFEYEMTAVIDLGGTSPISVIGDPSGIYTLVPGLRHDKLYERIPAVVINPVKIPRPFIKTAFFGE